MTQLKFFANGDIQANSIKALNSLPATVPVRAYFGNNDIVASQVYLANNGQIRVYANGTLAYGTFGGANVYVRQDAANSSTGSGFTSFSTTFSGNVLAGSLIHVFSSINGFSNTFANCVDSMGTTYTPIIPLSSNTFRVAEFWGVAANSGTLTVTVHYVAGTYDHPGLFIREIVNANTTLGPIANAAPTSAVTAVGGVINTVPVSYSSNTTANIFISSFAQDISIATNPSVDTANGYVGTPNSTIFTSNPAATFGTYLCQQQLTPNTYNINGSWLTNGQYEIAWAAFAGVNGQPQPSFVKILSDASEVATDGAIVPLGGTLPATSSAQTPTSNNDYLIAFAKYQNAALSVTDNVGGIYIPLVPDNHLFSNNTIALYNPHSNTHSQNVNISSTGAGTLKEAFLYEFANVGSITSFTIVANTSDPSGNIGGNTTVVPYNSILIARCSPSSTANGSNVVSPGTKLSTYSTANGVLGQWTGNGSSVTPTFTGGANTAYTISQMVLNPISEGFGSAMVLQSKANSTNVNTFVNFLNAGTFSSPVKPGSMIVVICSGPANDGPGPLTFHPKDNIGSVYVQAGAQLDDMSGGVQSVVMFYALNVKGGSCNVGYDMSRPSQNIAEGNANDNYLGILAIEIANVSIVVGANGTIQDAPTAGTNTVTSGNVYTSGPVYVIGFSMNTNGGSSDLGGSGLTGPNVGTSFAQNGFVGAGQYGPMVWKMDDSTPLGTLAAGPLWPIAGNVAVQFNGQTPNNSTNNDYCTVMLAVK